VVVSSSHPALQLLQAAVGDMWKSQIKEHSNEKKRTNKPPVGRRTPT
jgi:hypothetical protein